MAGFTEAQLIQIRDQIVANAGQPKSITVDGETYTQHALSELLAAYRLATAESRGALVFKKFVAGSSVG